MVALMSVRYNSDQIFLVFRTINHLGFMTVNKVRKSLGFLPNTAAALRRGIWGRIRARSSAKEGSRVRFLAKHQVVVNLRREFQRTSQRLPIQALLAAKRCATQRHRLQRQQCLHRFGFTAWPRGVNTSGANRAQRLLHRERGGQRTSGWIGRFGRRDLLGGSFRRFSKAGVRGVFRAVRLLRR